MRLRSYTARTAALAISQIRSELGEDAVIVATESHPGGKRVTVTAAVEPAAADAARLASPGLDLPGGAAGAAASPLVAAVRETLDRHGLPAGLARVLAETAATVEAAKPGLDPFLALAAVLDLRFGFAPLPADSADRPIMLVGPPGSGKTLAAAKLAARATLARRSAVLVAADAARAGACRQLAALAEILRLPLIQADSPEAMRRAARGCADKDFVLVDSPGVNPFDPGDMARLGELAEAAGAEPLLVLAAGGDAVESGEIAAAFAAVGASRLLATRLDVSRRLGGLLAAADGAVDFSEACANPQPGAAPEALSAVSLARLMLTDKPAQAAAPAEAPARTEVA